MLSDAPSQLEDGLHQMAMLHEMAMLRDSAQTPDSDTDSVRASDSETDSAKAATPQGMEMHLRVRPHPEPQKG